MKSSCICKRSLVIFIVELSTITPNVSPFLDKPSPATICPAPLNCVKSSSVVSTVITSGEFVSFVKIKPLSLLIFPNSTNVNAPYVMLLLESKSLVLTNELPDNS